MEINEITNLEEILKKLTPDKSKEFSSVLLDRLEDRRWCMCYGISYVNPEPDMRKVKSIILRELYPDLIY